MANQVWPKDALGNDIRIGKLIRLELSEAAGMFYVMGVTPATLIHDGEGGAMPVNGELELVLKFKMPFSPDRNQLHKALVIEQPKEEDSPGVH